MPSTSSMIRAAAGVGVPHTAAVGCSAPTSDSAPVSPATTPVMSLARCSTLGRVTTKRSGASTTEHRGSSAASAEARASSCSRLFLPEASSHSASPAGSAGPRAPSPVRRRAVPASTRQARRRPSRRTSSSGDAPTIPSTAKVQHEG